MKCADLHRTVVFTNPHPWGGVDVEGVKLKKVILLRIKWNIQICTEMLHFNPPSPWGTGMGREWSSKLFLIGFEWNVQICTEVIFPHSTLIRYEASPWVEVGWELSCKQFCFVRNWMKCPDLYKKVIFSKPLSHGDGGVKLQKAFFYKLHEMSRSAQKSHGWQHSPHGVEWGLGTRWQKSFLLDLHRKSSFSPPPLGLGPRYKWEFFVSNSKKCPDLQRHIVFDSPQPNVAGMG